MTAVTTCGDVTGEGVRRFGGVLGLSLLVAACGPGAGGAPGTPSAGAPAGPTASSQTVELTLKEYSITPSAIGVKAGAPVTFVANNAGTIGHALVVVGQGVSLATKDAAFPPGQNETISATLAPGTYMYFCPVDGHAAQGMEGTLTVSP